MEILDCKQYVINRLSSEIIKIQMIYFLIHVHNFVLH